MYNRLDFNTEKYMESLMHVLELSTVNLAKSIPNWKLY